MATCKDCIYRAMCYKHEHYGKENEEPCEMFKNKADFVEVVRCKKCKHGDVGIFEKTKDGQEIWKVYCDVHKRAHNLDWYCPWGVRKECEDEL